MVSNTELKQMVARLIDLGKLLREAENAWLQQSKPLNRDPEGPADKPAAVRPSGSEPGRAP